MAARATSYNSLVKEVKDFTKDVVGTTARQQFKNLLEQANFSLDEEYEILYNNNNSLDRQKLQEILSNIKKANNVINKALKLYDKDYVQNSQTGLIIAQCYLELASDFNYIFALINSLGTDESIEKVTFINENFSIFIGAKRFIISQNTIKNLIKEQQDQSIFLLKEDKGQLKLFISSSLKNYKILEQRSIFDDSVSEHYKQYKQYTREHYFGAQLTGRRLYYFLGKASKTSGERGKFWDWWKEETTKAALSKNNFIDFLKSFQDAKILSTALEDFLKTAAENNNMSILNNSASSLNWGHIAESFERHLEKHHSFGPTGYPADLNQSLGSYPDADETFEDWLDHLANSLGTWPGYFGPDTEYAQVKQYASSNSRYEIGIGKSNFEEARLYLMQFLDMVRKAENLQTQRAELQRVNRVDDASIEAAIENLKQITVQ